MPHVCLPRKTFPYKFWQARQAILNWLARSRGPTLARPAGEQAPKRLVDADAALRNRVHVHNIPFAGSGHTRHARELCGILRSRARILRQAWRPFAGISRGGEAWLPRSSIIFDPGCSCAGRNRNGPTGVSSFVCSYRRQLTLLPCRFVRTAVTVTSVTVCFFIP